MLIPVIRGLRAIALALPPLFAIIIAIPIAALPFVHDGRPFQSTYILLSAPVYLGLLCAPGYLYAVLTCKSAHQIEPGKRWWIRVSLILASVCALARILGGLMMALFIPPSLVALGSALYLLWHFERSRDQSREPDNVETS